MTNRNRKKKSNGAVKEKEQRLNVQTNSTMKEEKKHEPNSDITAILQENKNLQKLNYELLSRVSIQQEQINKLTDDVEYLKAIQGMQNEDANIGMQQSESVNVQNGLENYEQSSQSASVTQPQLAVEIQQVHESTEIVRYTNEVFDNNKQDNYQHNQLDDGSFNENNIDDPFIKYKDKNRELIISNGTIIVAAIVAAVVVAAVIAIVWIGSTAAIGSVGTTIGSWFGCISRLFS